MLVMHLQCFGEGVCPPTLFSFEACTLQSLTYKKDHDMNKGPCLKLRTKKRAIRLQIAGAGGGGGGEGLNRLILFRLSHANCKLAVWGRSLNICIFARSQLCFSKPCKLQAYLEKEDHAMKKDLHSKHASLSPTC